MKGRGGAEGGGKKERGRLRRLLRVPRPVRQQASSELEAEFELHLELRAEELEAEGLSPEEARREALRLFGDPERVRREMLRSATRHVRRQRGREAVWNMVRDIRYAARSLVRAPGFTVLAVATLAVGIGANTAIYSVVDAVLLEPLPLPQANRVAMIWEAREPGDRNVVNPANFVDWRERSESFQTMAGIYQTPVTVLSGGRAREVPMQFVHPDLFPVLGVPPHLGRTFSPGEGAGALGTAQVAVLTHGFWRDHFGGDPEVVGKTLELTGGSAEVIGVMGPELDFFAPDLGFWMPSDFEWATHGGRFIRVVGRLAPGASMEGASSEMERIMAGLREAHPDFNDEWYTTVVPLDEQVKGDVRPALLILLGAVGVLLLVTCVNIANLLLVRSASRRTEVAVRASLGAGRGRIMRELLTESLLLSLVGGALGVLLAFAATRGLVAALPESLQVPRLDQTSVDLGVLTFAALVAVLTGLIFGLAPVVDAFRTDLMGQLREGGRGGGGGVRARRLRAAVVVGEVALSLMLLIGAGLLLRSFVELQRTDLGLRPQNVITGRVTMQGQRYGQQESRETFVREAVETVAALPDVMAAGAISWLPLSGAWSGDSYYLPGQPRPASSDMLPTEVQAVEGEIFEALGMTLVQGRSFTPADAAGAPEVVIVNESLVAQSWPGEDPIGKRLILTWGEDRLLEVVGVVGDVRQRGVEEGGHPGLYRPYAQFPAFASMTLVARSTTGGGAVGRQIVERIQQIDPNMAVADVGTMRGRVADAIVRPRLTSYAVGFFAVLALLLAALGIYGVLSYAVSLRSHELSIRQALGAEAGEVGRLVLREALVLAGLGVVIGGLAAAAGTRLLESQLYQVGRWDPWVFAGMPLLLLAIAMAAAAVPAVRAARVSPSLAMRDE